MKTYIFRFLACGFLATRLFSSCNDLDQEPTNKFTDDRFWSSPARAEMVINMAYNQMYGHGKIWDDESLSDNMANTRGSSDPRTIRASQANASTGLFNSEWKWCFEGIKTTNVFMDKVDLVPAMDVTAKNRMKAQVRFIRASLFFRLSNFYGDIPFFLSDITLAQSKTMTRTARSTVIAKLHQELDEIIPMLPKREDLTVDQRGQITRAAAMMLQARIYLQESNMPKVEEICGKLINDQANYGTYSLFNTASTGYSAYENLFTSAYEYNSEVILDYSAVPLVKEWSALVDMVPRTVSGSRIIARSPVQSLVDDYVMIANGKRFDELGSGYVDATPYANRDLRMSATVVYDKFVWRDKDTNGVPTSQVINIQPSSGGNSATNGYNTSNATLTGYYVRKYFDPDHLNDLKMSTNIIMMRYADVLLMYAEACVVNGTFDAAKWNTTIRAIRERAGFSTAAALDFPDVSGDANPTQAMLKIVKRERRVELAFEGLRYFDIMRWGEGPQLLNGVVLGAKFANNNTDFVRVDSRVFNSRDVLWSLPQSEMDIAPSLKPNNTGY